MTKFNAALRRGRVVPVLCGAITALIASVPSIAQESGAVLDEVVVTARKIEEKLNDVPVAITAYSAETLARSNVTSLADIAAFTPGFSFEAYNSGTTPAPLIRGLTQNALTDRNQNVATFVDGIHVQQQGNIDFSLLDLERIEIIKGPQNAQYGRSSFAGAINWVPKRPVLGAWEGSAGLVYGSDERKDVSASINIPVWGEKLAIRAYGKKTEFDGTFKNNYPGSGTAIASSAFGGKFDGNEGNLGGWDNDAVQVSLRFRPVEPLTIDLLYFRSKTRNEPGAGLVLQPTTAAQRPGATAAQQNPHNCSPAANGINQLICGEIPIDESRVLADPRSTGSQTHSDLLSGRIEYRFSESLTATYLYGKGLYDAANYQAATQPELLVNGNAALGGQLIFVSNPFTDQKSESHEFRLDGKFGTVGWRAGYYTNAVNDVGAAAYFTFRRPLVSDPTNSFVVSGLAAGPNSLLTRFIDKIESPFLSVTVPFAEVWTVDLEGRYSKETRRQVQLPNTNFRRGFSEFTPRVNLRWKPREAWTFYASAARGAKSGGFNGVTADVATFEPESNLTYEIGAKQTLWERRLQLNYAVFMTDWKDLQLSVPDTIPSGLIAVGVQEGNFIGNVKGADSKGFEVEAQVVLTERLKGRLAASYVQSTFKGGTIDTTFGRLCETPGTPVCTFLPRTRVGIVPGPLPLGGSPIGGNDLPRTPTTQAAVGLDYRIPVGPVALTLRGDVTYQNKFYAENLNLAFMPDRTLLNLDVGVEDPDGAWSVNLWGKNVTDEVYASSAFAVSVERQYVPTLGLGATYGLTARYNFRGTK